jgi:hypothetical protein
MIVLVPLLLALLKRIRRRANHLPQPIAEDITMEAARSPS